MATLAVDLGGTHLRCGAVTPDGTVIARIERDTPHDGTGTDALTAVMREVATGNECDAAVVGVPGRVDYRIGRLEHAPNLPPAWVGGLTEVALGQATGLPVALANDADLAAVGEAYFGAGRKFSDVAYVTISTGIGAGVVLGGLLVHGRRSMVEVGHTIIDLTRRRVGEPATLEELGSGTALGRAAVAAGLGTRGQQVLDARAAGNPVAAEMWDALVAAVAAGIVNVGWLFTPEVVVVGGGLGLIGDVLLGPVRDAVASSGPPAIDPPIAVQQAALGDDAGLVGAAAWRQAFVPEQAGR